MKRIVPCFRWFNRRHEASLEADSTPRQVAELQRRLWRRVLTELRQAPTQPRAAPSAKIG